MQLSNESGSRSIAQELRRLILFSVLPFVVLLGVLGYVGYHDARSDAEAYVSRRAARVSADEVKFISDTERALRMVAARPDVRRMDAARCDPGLGELIAIQPRYFNVAVIDRAGWVVCGATPPQGGPRSLNVADREWFRAVLSGKAFALSAPRQGPILNRWMSIAAAPVHGAGGEIVGAVSAAIDLAAWDPATSRVTPEDSVLGVIDRAGTIVMRFPDAAKWVGQNNSHTEIVATMLRIGDGVFSAPGVQGFERIWAVTPIPGTDWLAYAGVRTGSILGPQIREIALALALAAAALAVAVWLALTTARRLAEPITGIARAVRERAAGSSAPVVIAGPLEVQEVAQELNRMIGERQRTEAALREHDARYRTVVETSSDGFWVADLEGRLLDVNDAYVRRSGYTRDELLGMRISDLEANEMPEDIAAHMNTVLNKGTDTFETVHRAKDGRLWAVEASVRNRTDYPGQVLAFVRDITGRKREEAILRARLRLTELAQGGPLDDLLQHALEAAEEITGSQIGFFHFVDPDQEHLTLQVWSKSTLAHMCTAEGKGQHYAIAEAGVWVDCFRARAPVIHNDYAGLAHKKGLPAGHAPVIRELVVPILRAGKVTEILGVGNKATDYLQEDVDAVQVIAGMVQDIVERRRAESALKESESRLAAVFRASPIGIVVSRIADGVILDVNAAALRLYGYTREQVIGHTGTELGAYPNPAQREQMVQNLREQGSIDRFTIDYRASGGEIGVLEVSGRIIELQGEPCLLAMTMEVTERKRLEEVHLQAQKLESLGTLTGGIAHDFNNILAAIRGNADLAAEDVGPDHIAAESLEEIRKATTRASELVRRIMAFGRSKETAQQAVDLGAVVGEVLRLLRSTLPAGIALNVDFADDTPQVLADEGQVHEAVVNLTTNAAYAIGPRAGSISYRLEPVQVGARRARSIPGLAPGRYVRLTVTDSGCGMDAATLERIFDAFYTTKPVGEGTGLGLSMVHGTMRSQGGAVTVESAPGKGSSFHLYFPAAAGKVVKDTPDVPEPGLLVAGQRVLYVDDEEALVFLAHRVLSRLGHSVAGFTDPGEALEALRAHPQDYDVVVTDLSMPGMSGFELARAVLALRPQLPVLMTTGYVRSEDESTARDIGIRELILKPATMDELGRVLDRLFRAAGAAAPH